MNYDLYWVWLSCALGAGASCLELVSYYEWDPYVIYGTAYNEIEKLDILTKRQLEKLKSFPLEKAEEILSLSRKMGIKILTPSSEHYPKRLLCTDDLPLTLYVDGDETAFDNELAISVVGARKASDYGRAVARALSGALSSRGFTIVSGGALGIDSSAHLGALDEKAQTICVLGCGLGTRYLMENEPLRQKIRENGCLVTEYPPKTPASRVSFPLRNRIISGMSLGTVVVEAGERSGSLITARLALEQGKDVFAVPGDLVSSSFLGTNNLIRNGAIPVFSPNDILEEYCHKYFDRINDSNRLPDDEIINRAQKFLADENFLKENKKENLKNNPLKKENKKQRAKIDVVKEDAPKILEKKDAPSYLTPNAKKVYDVIGTEPIHIDEIINVCNLQTSETLSAITELEIYGLIAEVEGRQYTLS